MEPKVIATNRKAYHDYYIIERVEAGLVLTGTEIKSIRNGRVDIREAFAKPQRGDFWLYNCFIPPYEQGNIYNQLPTRPRKLLLHKEQIRELVAMTSQKGYTLVPLQLYIKNHVAKVELGIARGKRKWEKRQVIIEREKDREAREALKHSRR